MAVADFENSSTSNGQKEANDLCSICYHPWKSDGSHRVCCLPCGHVYGKSCIENWLEIDRPVVESISQGELVWYKKCPQCKKLFGKHNITDLYGIGMSSNEISRKTLQMIADISSTNPSNLCECPYCRVGQGKHTSTCKFALLEMRVDFLKNEVEFLSRDGLSSKVDEWYERFKRVPRLSDVALVQNSERPDIARAQIVRSPSHNAGDNRENDMVTVPMDDDDDHSSGDDGNVNANSAGTGDSGGNNEEANSDSGDDTLGSYNDDDGGGDGNNAEDDNDGGGDGNGRGISDEDVDNGINDTLAYYNYGGGGAIRNSRGIGDGDDDNADDDIPAYYDVDGGGVGVGNVDEDDYDSGDDLLSFSNDDDDNNASYNDDNGRGAIGIGHRIGNEYIDNGSYDSLAYYNDGDGGGGGNVDEGYTDVGDDVLSVYSGDDDGYSGGGGGYNGNYDDDIYSDYSDDPFCYYDDDDGDHDYDYDDEDYVMGDDNDDSGSDGDGGGWGYQEYGPLHDTGDYMDIS